MGVRVQVQVSIGASALDCMRQPDACACSQRLFTFAGSIGSSTTSIAQQEILVKWHGLVEIQISVASHRELLRAGMFRQGELLHRSLHTA